MMVLAVDPEEEEEVELDDVDEDDDAPCPDELPPLLPFGSSPAPPVQATRASAKSARLISSSRR